MASVGCLLEQLSWCHEPDQNTVPSWIEISVWGQKFWPRTESLNISIRTDLRKRNSNNSENLRLRFRNSLVEDDRTDPVADTGPKAGGRTENWDKLVTKHSVHLRQRWKIASQAEIWDRNALPRPVRKREEKMICLHYGRLIHHWWITSSRGWWRG